MGQSNNVDGEILTKLTHALENPEALVSFIAGGQLPKVLSAWSFYGSNRDYKHFDDFTDQMARLGDLINTASSCKDASGIAIATQLVELRPQIIAYYRDMFTHQWPCVARGLSTRRSVAVGMLHTLTAAVQYDAVCATDLLNQFDFNLNVLPELLQPRKGKGQGIPTVGSEGELPRHAFIEFWTVFTGTISHIHRKDVLIQNHKIMNNLWRYMAEGDNVVTLKLILNWIDISILQESSFLRATKCKILNENVMHKLVPLFGRLTVKPLSTEFHDLIVKMATDAKHGLAFPVRNPWASSGSEVTYNNKKFPIHNQLVFTLLTALKPWEHHPQLTVVVEIMATHQAELLGPYMNWMVENGGGYHEPALSSWWIGHTLLHTQLLQLEYTDPASEPADSRRLAEVVGLAPLSKGALTRCLEFNTPMVVQFALNLIEYTLQRLDRFLKLDLCPAPELVELVFAQMPEAAKIIDLVDRNDLVRVTTLSILNHYEALRPAALSLAKMATAGVTEAMKSLTPYNVVLLDRYLAILASQDRDADIRWWHGSPSLFTCLLQLSAQSNARAMISRLVEGTMVFATDLAASPLDALIASVQDVEDPAVWKVIDESISRAMRTPYKYYDLSQAKYHGLSVFMVVVAEQTQFATKETANPSLIAWVSRFFRYCVVAGESQEDLAKLCEDFGLSADVTNAPLEGLVGYLLDDKVTAKQMETKRITSRLEFGAGLLRFKRELEHPAVAVSIFSALVDYVLADKKVAQWVRQSPRFYRGLWQSEFALSLVSELLALCPGPSYVNTMVMETRQVGPFAWLLTNDEIRQLLTDVATPDLALECARRSISVDTEWFDRVGACAGASQLIAKGLVKFDNPATALARIVGERQLDLLGPFVQSADDDLREQSVKYLIESPAVREDAEMAVTVAALLPSDHPFVLSTVPLAQKFVTWAPSLTVLKTSPTTENLEAAYQYVATHGDIYGFCPEFVDLVDAAGSPDPVWFHKCMLYITKMYAESDALPKSFDEFVARMTLFVGRHHVWSKVPAAIINTQLEVFTALPWVTNPGYLKFAVAVVMACSNRAVAYQKVLQIFISNEKMVLHELFESESESAGNAEEIAANSEVRVLSALLISKLFNVDASKCSSAGLMDQVLCLYQGTTRYEDIILKQVSQTIESKTSRSWINGVAEWSFVENEARLVTKDPAGLVVTLRKDFVQGSCTVKPTVNFNITTLADISELLAVPQPDSAYDPEFLMMAIVSNDELVTMRETPRFDVAKLVSSGLLASVVCAVGSSASHVSGAARVLIGGMVRSLAAEEETYKDKRVMGIYLSNILYTFEQQYAHDVPPIVWYVYAQMAGVLANPGHYMYEPTYRYVLGHPKVTSRDIPMYHVVVSAGTTTVDEDFYYRQVSWMLTQLATGLQVQADVVLVRNMGIPEWAFNLLNSPYTSPRLRGLVTAFIAQIQQVESGVDVLVTRFAGLAAVESQSMARPEDIQMKQLMLRFGLGESKRLHEWSNHDLERVVKRVKI
ncbi:nucleolar pre-ribosomal-associated protein 1 [Diutina catenulata]